MREEEAEYSKDSRVCVRALLCVCVQDIQQENQTVLERKTLRRAFYSREAKNQLDDDEEGDPLGSSPPLPILSSSSPIRSLSRWIVPL